jgi:hypothetical protein
MIGHYRITAKLGEGGMGAVFRATDTKLGREVAVKVLPDEFAGDLDRLARFTREAQVLASLNHPNIAAIHGVEERALVMELVEGGEPRGPLSGNEALPIIQQLIDALEYAHDKGVVHRDLKPANLKLTPEGRLKVLDFGLAKALAAETGAAGGNVANSPTLTMRATNAGMILGTAAYMAPEQARGQTVDRRADIWAFGVIVYELLTGKPLFEAATVTDTLAAVLRQEVDLTAAPARFHRLLRLCLARDPRERLSHISGARLLLEEPAAAGVSSRRAILPWVAAAGASALAGAAWLRAPQKVELPLIRVQTELSPQAAGSLQMTAAISPDGKRLAFRVRTPGGYALAIRALDQLHATTLPGTEGVSWAFFSPDSEWVGFYVGSSMRLMKVAVQGGAPVTITDATQWFGATWLPDGTIVGGVMGALGRFPATGGKPEMIAIGKQELFRQPQGLPDGEHVLVTVAPVGTMNFDSGTVEAISLKTGQRKEVLRGGYYGRYLPTGHLLYVSGATLYATRFDAASLKVRGAAVPLLEDVATNPSEGSGRFDYSQTGTLVYASGKPFSAQQPIVIQDSSGTQTPIAGAAGSSVRLSPDGKRLAYSATGDLWVYELARGAPVRITFDPTGNFRNPTWTPDGKYLAYSGAGGLWWTRSDGAGRPFRILEDTPEPTPWSIAAFGGPQSLRLAFHKRDGNRRKIWILPLNVTNADAPAAGVPEALTNSAEVETAPAFSPDGRFIAYTSGSALMVQRYRPGAPGQGGKWQLDAHSTFPVWSHKGGQLFFRTGSQQIMVVDYTTSGDAFSAGGPRNWSPTLIFATSTFQNYDMFPDGKRAVVVSLPQQYKAGAGYEATLLINFFDEVKRRLP